MATYKQLSKAQGALLGQLSGDSLGSLVEFCSIEQIKDRYPDRVRFLADGGPFDLIAGQPTDDSEMALLLARNLVQRRKFDANDVFREYLFWRGSEPFDCGTTIDSALRGRPNPYSQANGALMRVSPLGIFGTYQPPEKVASWAQADAALTHPNEVCLHINSLFVVAIATAIREEISPEKLYSLILRQAENESAPEFVIAAIKNARTDPPDDFYTNMGWVLIAFQNALYQLVNAPTLEEGIVDTVWRGGDTDTNAAIAGALLGAVHGRHAIPEQWQKAILECRPQHGRTGVIRPRPECLWPVDAPELAERLIFAGKP